MEEGVKEINIDYKWIRADMDLYHIEKDSRYKITVKNSGNLDSDFCQYAYNFYAAAEQAICFLFEEASPRYDIAKLDLWFFAIIYLYRQSLELILKANLFQSITDTDSRKEIIGEVRHDLKRAFEKLVEIRKLAISENENAEWLMAFLTDISELDRESDMFRYPFGNYFKILFERQTHVSLTATRDNMNRAYVTIKELFETGCFPEKNYAAYAPQLIIEDGYFYQQSVVGYQFSKYSFYPYVSSYNKVAVFLKDRIIVQGSTDLFMPMCYLYRNAIELALKRLIIEDSHIDAEKAKRIIRRKNHSIQGLWNSIIGEIRTCAEIPGDDTTLTDAERYIQMFHNLDNSSDLFRYPCDKHLNSYFLEAEEFDMNNVASCFEELCNFLDAVEVQMSRMKEFEEEMVR